MKLENVVAASREVTAVRGRLEKIARLADCLRGASPDEAHIIVAWLSGELPQGRIGAGPAAIRSALPATGAALPTLQVRDVHDAFTAIAAISGAVSSEQRRLALQSVFERATIAEQEFLGALLFGELRQGAQEGVMLDAVARAAAVAPAELRRAAMLAGNLPAVARAAFAGGTGALTAFRLQLFRPVQPMLAQTATDVGEALEKLGEAGFEYKLDGARVQVHRSGDEVRVFTRGLHDVTSSSADLVEAVRRLTVRDIVLDGEAIGLQGDGRPLPFQQTMRRFARKGGAASKASLRCFFFDCLHVDGETLIDAPARARWAAMERVLPAVLRIPRTITRDAVVAATVMEDALSAGHEGLVAKAPDASYETGTRGAAWLKIKPSHTFDLVVLAAEWGHGRRQGWLSNLHLGARDPDTGEWVMVGKTYKGMTDEMLVWQTGELLALEVSRTRHAVVVRPALVVEVAIDGVLSSPRYEGGISLRFARVKRYRSDKKAAEADTIDALRALLKAGRGV